MKRTIAVIDLKSFYASCECACRHLDPFSTPLVCCDPYRSGSSVVMSVSPFLKERYGIPNVCRRRDLPDIDGMIYAIPRMSYYLKVSAKVLSIFLDYVALEDIHVYSVDESFLDLTSYLSYYRCSPETIVKRIQGDIKRKLGITATAGITYRFNQRNWERGVPGYTAEDIRAFQDAVASSNAALEAAQAENDRLNDELTAADARAKAAEQAAADARAKAAAEAKKVNNSSCPTSIILYDYSMSKLTAKDKTRLELTAELIKNGPKDRVYTIQGHADQQTGTLAGNRRVAENRAKNVYDYLVKCGVNPKQLTYEGLGNEPDVYKNIQKANRSVIIK